MMNLGLNISPCPNDTFMFDALVNRRIDCGDMSLTVGYHDIEELNRLAMEGRPQVTKISAAVFAQVAGRYRLLDSGAALGRGNGPLLVRRSGDTRPIKRIAVPGMHTTANMLVSRLFPEIGERHPMLFSEIAQAVERGEYDAGVLIHEGRFVYGRHNLELVADLGERWEAQTGLPLPLGVIVIRRDVPDDVAARFEALLRQSIAHAMANPEASRGYVKSHAQEMDDEVIDKHISLFVNDFSLSLGHSGREAIGLLTGLQDE